MEAQFELLWTKQAESGAPEREVLGSIPRQPMSRITRSRLRNQDRSKCLVLVRDHLLVRLIGIMGTTNAPSPVKHLFPMVVPQFELRKIRRWTGCSSLHFLRQASGHF